MIANATKDKLNSTSSEYPSKFPIKTWKWYIFWKSQVPKSLINWQDCMNPLAVEQRGEDLSQDWMFHEMFPFKYVLAFELNLCCTCTVSTDIGCRFSHLCLVLSVHFISESDTCNSCHDIILLLSFLRQLLCLNSQLNKKRLFTFKRWLL